MKFTTEDVKNAMINADVDIRVVSQVIDKLNTIAAEQEQEPDEPREKWDTVILINADQLSNEAGYGWVIKVPEGTPPTTAMLSIQQAGGAFNLTKKGQRVPVHNVAEAIENYKPGIMADLYHVKVVTKAQVVALPMNGSTPVISPVN
jgi:signal recognition particle GTPase